MKLFGPFSQLLPMSGLSLRGPLRDEALETISDAGLVCDENGYIVDVGAYRQLEQRYPDAEKIFSANDGEVAVPGFIDCHTHICFSGNRAKDFAMRNAGKSYLQIAEAGGGIWSSVQHTRSASHEDLVEGILTRVNQLAAGGVTTIECKSGYGLTVDDELKMLRAICEADKKTPVSLISTCLAAHLKPKDFQGSSAEYLSHMAEHLLPKVHAEALADRVDIFIEKSAFLPEESLHYLRKAKSMGFQLTVHADQFTPGSSRIAVEAGAVSADHLEATIDEDITLLAKSDTVAVALPGASLGLGEPFTPARKLLDAGACLAIASDFNPGSAPMGNLVMQASVLATYQKLSTAEVLAGLTYRAAHALRISDRGVLQKGKRADFAVFPTHQYQDILYYQGMMPASKVYSQGKLIF